MIRINLLPVRAQRKKQAFVQSIVLFASGLVAVVVVCVVLNVGIGSSISKLETENQQIRTEIENLKKIIGEIEAYEVMIAERQKKKEVIETLKANKQGPVRILDEIALRVPKRVWIKSLRRRGPALELKGSAVNQRLVAEFMRALEESDYFKGVELVEIQRDSKKEAEYKLHDFVLRASADMPKKKQASAPAAPEGDEGGQD